jgi:hypothetical protein
MRFISQKALILAKMAVALANATFGEWIGTDAHISLRGTSCEWEM